MDLLLQEQLFMIAPQMCYHSVQGSSCPWNGPPDSQSHGNAIQLSPVDAHEPIPEMVFWEFALAPVALEVAAKAYVTGICEKMTLHAGEPMGLI